MLVVSDLVVGYGQVTVVWGASFRVDDGEIVTIVGPNGAGKSTILKTVAGLLKPGAGQITFRGSGIGGLTASEVAAHGLALVPEGREIFPAMTVHEHLLIGGRRRNRGGVANGLDRVYSLFPRLAERRRQVASTLSGGEQQMLAIARALMADPHLLLLDEPSTGLAPIVVEHLFDVIRALGATGVTTLLVEQNVHMALEVSARAYVLERGRVVLEGAPQTLVDHPLVAEAYLGLAAPRNGEKRTGLSGAE